MSESVPVAVPVSDSTSTSDSIAAPASASASAAAPSDSSTSESESGSAAAASGSASAVLILRAIADRVEKSCINGRVGDDTVERLNVEDGEHQNVIALLAVYQHDASLYVEGTRLLAAWAQGDWNCTQLIHEQVSAPLFSALVHFGAPLPSSSPASLITCHSIIVSRAIRCLALLTRIPNVCIALIEAGLEKHIRTIIAKSLCITDHDNAVAIITIIDHIHNQQPDKSLLVTSGLHLSLFQLISVHISSLPLVRQSLARILVGITAHPSNRSQLLKDGIEQLLVKCLSHPSHAVDNDIGRSFCVCVGNLAGDSLEHSATLYSHGFVHHVVDVMHAHPSSTAVQIAACRALRALTLRSPAPASTSTGVDSAPLATSPLSPTSAARRGLIESGVFEAVTAAMIRGDTIKEAHVHAYTEDTQHKPELVGSLSSSAELLSLCCCILSQLCVSDAAVSLLYSLHAPQLILATLAHHGGDATVAQHATTAIAHLANNNVSRGMLVSVGAYGAIQSALSKHQHVAAVQQAGISALIQINGFTLQQLAI